MQEDERGVRREAETTIWRKEKQREIQNGRNNVSKNNKMGEHANSVNKWSF
jgi:hypothetical protein